MRLLQVLIAICGLLLTAFILSFVATHKTEPPSRQEQFVSCCQAVFSTSAEECLVFMERWGGFMAK